MAHLQGGSVSRGSAAARIESSRAINKSLIRCKILLECGSTADFTYDHCISQWQGEQCPRPTASVLSGSKVRTATALSHADHALDLASYYNQPQLVAKSQLFRGHCFRRMAQWDKAYWCYVRAASVREFAAEKGPEGLEASTKECQRRLGRRKECHYSSDSEEISSGYGSDDVVCRSGKEHISETPTALDTNIKDVQKLMGKEEEKGKHSLELDMDDNDQHSRGDSISCDYPIQGIAGNVSGFASLRSRQGSEAADGTPTAMSFKEMMNCFFARVKSKDTAKNDAAWPATTLRDISEEQCKLQRREQRENNEVFGPGAILFSGLSRSSFFANQSALQHQHDYSEVCCTCDNKSRQEDGQGKPTESECEPWWWVMQTGFYSLVYCVYDFATAVQYLWLSPS
ncbi:hypothetical protein NEUTE1DRAFT_113096 [Neurospora tetrasperma FGSC 2508]|uniref:Uncharacterized protein n=1 Tax=Neurospora tetrasperma (strain FGSC 2508 / ATCC MYA-4615 / P0657) TaxID=510951 RepID=F8MUZ7_NEUT8|nr:uncharacterized protein NEUTE1DRAFT_113096 [Neurospora tetrasperma FGSC 2508]EGO54622.1 hypothetical protein NEUTE1DRAFT_113096 [Neurospora tetrasperma FGSC 2508]EGZ71141.1 hypothetical protein NEUTE2DRAFT_142304 [Neurospora tetrasperma FGSC 2509]